MSGVIMPRMKARVECSISSGSCEPDMEFPMKKYVLATAHAPMTRHETANPGERSETITHFAFDTTWGNATAAAEAVAPIFDT